MTTQEFSNTFDTLLNSYANKAVFGDQASHQEIVLDEYEKSVLLTQAQDIIVKQYFQQSSVSEGFDGSIRRQIDFSSLITVTERDPVWAEDASNLIKVESEEESYEYGKKFAENSWLFPLPNTAKTGQKRTSPSEDWQNINVPISTILFILNEKLILTNIEHIPQSDNVAAHDEIKGKKEYVVVPINYLEYDRQMSKPFAQPLKKQCWRLLQDNNVGSESDGSLFAEIIPTNDALKLTEYDEENVRHWFPKYKIRYVRRPKPIVLVDLTNTGLSVDGATAVTECELNPILHMDILNKAVELAYTTRAGGSQRQNREQQ